MTVLGKGEILKELSSGQLVIDPFDPANLGPNSYDLTLGENFWVPDQRKLYPPSSEWYFGPYARALNEVSYDPSCFSLAGAIGEDPAYKATVIFNPYSSGGLRLLQAAAWSVLVQELNLPSSWAETQGFAPADKVFILPPHGTALGHSIEFAGSASTSFCTLLRSRSGWARVGVSFGGGAGWGDSMFFNRWGLRIVNHTPYAIPLLMGTRVAQLVFMSCGGEELEGYQGSYQSATTLEQLKEAWNPELLLPRLDKDLERAHRS